MASGVGEAEVELESRDDEGHFVNTMEASKEHKKYMHSLEKQVFRLACFYFLFQGLILTAFYKAPTHVKCHYRWIPMSLSGVAGTLNFIVLVDIVFRYKRSMNSSAMYNKDSKTSVMVICVVAVLAFLLFALAGFWVVTCDPAGHD